MFFDATGRLPRAGFDAVIGNPPYDVLSEAETGRFPLLEVALDERGLGQTAAAVSRGLQAGDPPVHLGERRAVEGVLTVHPEGLRDGDEGVVTARLVSVLAGPR